MEDQTTRETSISLHKVGFKPEIRSGQSVYYYNGDLEFAFPATAIDLLKEMPSTIGRQIRLSFGGETFCVTVTETIDGNRSETYFFNKNAAEALAEAYLHLKKMTATEFQDLALESGMKIGFKYDFTFVESCDDRIWCLLLSDRAVALARENRVETEESQQGILAFFASERK